ncbi:YitT family protein [Frigidibacter oleivorans]|uniref:YitT family protein n=1 Tax=Frigidibacter oleivorans TaxID=2487129 RepID=UPI000F8D67CC|nr:YitT family protein [Frigidibacter oleivorans]
MAADLNPPLPGAAPATPRYTLVEDLQGLFISTVQCALAIHLLRTAGLSTGGTAGLALLIGYATGWSFGWVFFLVNLPFYAIAWMRKGRGFAVKSFVSVAAVSALADAMPPWVTIAAIHPAAAAVLFGVVAGAGLLGLFRHASSLGGVSIVAVIVQDRWGIRAGWVQLGYDACLFLVSFAVLAPAQVGWSLLGAVMLNLVIAMNHRRDWYVAA